MARSETSGTPRTCRVGAVADAVLDIHARHESSFFHAVGACARETVDSLAAASTASRMLKSATTQSHAVSVEDDCAILARVVVRWGGRREARHAAQARRHILALGLRQQREAEAELHGSTSDALQLVRPRRASLVIPRCQAVLLHSSCTEPIERAISAPTTYPDLAGTNPRPQLSATPLGAACGTWLASEPKCSAEAFVGPDPLPFAPAVLGWQSYKPPCTLRPKTRPAGVGLGGAPPPRPAAIIHRSTTDPDGLLTYPADGGTGHPHAINAKKEEAKNLTPRTPRRACTAGSAARSGRTRGAAPPAPNSGACPRRRRRPSSGSLRRPAIYVIHDATAPPLFF